MKRTEADCIIIGAGPAGLKAGTILQSLGYKIFILEKEDQPGGKLLLWNTLFPHNESAMEILNPLLKDQKKNIMTSVQIETITKSPEEFTVADQNQTIYTSPALFISTGFKPFNAGRKEEYGYGIYDNVITSVELEDKLKNNNITMTNGKVPDKVAMIHCVGSRDIKVGNEYCSSVCCITGIKQAMELGKRIPGIQVSCLYMDLRLNGRFYEDNYKMAQMSHKIQFIRGRLSETNEDVDGSLVIRYEDTLAGKPAKMTVDMIVLLVGMQLDKSVSRICPLINEQTGSDGFFILLPFSRYMHIFTEIPHIFLKNANIEVLHDDGITNFQVHACSLCGICLDTCQMNVNTGLMGQSLYFLRNLRNGKKPKENSIMNCLMCGRCKQVCPVQVDTLSIRMNERNRMNGKMNYDFSYLDEASWPAFQSRIVFFGGCMTRLTPAIREAMKKIFMLTGEDFIFIDEYEAICCGRPLLLSGQYEAFREIVNRTRRRILDCHPALIVTTCPICLNTFKNDYYFQVPVVHHSQYLNSLIKEGRFIPQRNGVKTVYHDPCELGRDQGIYSEPRKVLDSLVYLQNKDYKAGDGLCCGGSLADLELDVEEKMQIARETIEQIVTNDTQQLTTGCPLCKMTFQMAGLYPVKDLAEIYAESMITLPVEKITANRKIRNYSNMPVNR